MMIARLHLSAVLSAMSLTLPAAGSGRPKDPPCTSCVVQVGLGPSLGILLSDFDSAPVAQSRLGTGWSGFNDAEGRIDISGPSDYSRFTRGALVDSAMPAGPSALVIQGNGRVGNGAAIEFALGKKFYPISSFTPVEPFIGLSLALSNERGDTYDLATDSVAGIYFEYRLAGTGIALVRFEARAYQPDWSVAVDQGRHWWGRSLPTTGGAWQGARILFSELQMPEEGKALVDSARRPLNTREMMFLQWSVYGDTGSAGSLALDHVYFIGARSLTPLPSPIRRKPIQGPVASSDRIKPWVSGRLLHASVPLATVGNSVALIAPGGEVVYQGVLPVGSFDLDLSRYPKGLYYLLTGPGKYRKVRNQVHPVPIL